MDFDTWLIQRLQELKTDEAVFGPYIKGILEGDEELDEKIETLDEILADLGDPKLDVESLRKEILSRWNDQSALNKTSSSLQNGSGDFSPNLFAIPTSGTNGASISSTENGPVNQAHNGTSSLEDHLEQLLRLGPEKLAGGSSENKGAKDLSLASADSALRAAILNQYREDQSNSEEEDGPEKGSGGGLSRNTNAERVLSEQKEYRENAKAESAKKREKDKEDRAKQKKLAEERKDKAKKKSAKVERKR